MKCDEARRRIDLFIDGELPVLENMQVLEHLNACTECAGVYEGEKRLRSTFRAQLATVRAPVRLTQRITKVVRSTGETKRNGWKVLLAACAVVMVSAVVLLSSASAQPRALAAEVVRRHEADRAGFACANTPERRCLCDACTNDAAADAEDFCGKHGCGCGCRDFGLGKFGYRLAGVAGWSWKGRDVCWTVRRTRLGAAVSHVRYAGPVSMDPDEVRFLWQGGRGVVFIPSGEGETSIFAFDDVDEARRFVGTVELGTGRR